MNSKRGYLTFLALFLVLLCSFFVKANFVCGTLYGVEDTSPSWVLIESYYLNNPLERTSCRVSPLDNKYCCDTHEIFGSWEIGKTVNAEIFDFKKGHFAGPVSLNISGEGYDVFPEMSLKEMIKINSPNKKIFMNKTTILFNITLGEGFYNLSYSVNSSEGFFEQEICFPCEKNLSFNLTGLSYGKNQISFISFSNKGKFEKNLSLTILNWISFEREFICDSCNSQNSLPSGKDMLIKIRLNASHHLEGALRDFFPYDWNIISGEESFVYSDTHNFLEWDLEGENETFFEKEYILRPPENILPRKYSFWSSFEDKESAEYKIVLRKFFGNGLFSIPQSSGIKSKPLYTQNYFFIPSQKSVLLEVNQERITKLIFSISEDFSNLKISLRDRSVRKFPGSFDSFSIESNMNNDNIENIQIYLNLTAYDKENFKFYHHNGNSWVEIIPENPTNPENITGHYILNINQKGDIVIYKEKNSFLFGFFNLNLNNVLKKEVELKNFGLHYLFEISSYETLFERFLIIFSNKKILKESQTPSSFDQKEDFLYCNKELIEIISAEHLDSKRNLIKDIYGYVYELDDIWSPEVSSGDYVRIIFEEELSSTNYIKLYARIISGNPKIELYNLGGKEIISELDEVAENKSNKLYLANLEYPLSGFDLKVVGGSLEFNYIVDPETGGTTSGGLRPQEVTCYAEGSVTTCQGTYPASCPTDRLSCGDGQREDHLTRRGNFAGVFATYYNETIEPECGKIKSVQLCYSWGSSNADPTLCDISFHNGDSIWVTRVSSCPGTGGSSGCINITANKTWQCSNFFGISGSKSVIRARQSSPQQGRTSSAQIDALYFLVDYDPPAPKLNITSPKNTTYGSKSFSLNVNVSLNENGSAVFYSLDNWQTNTTLSTTNNRDYYGSVEDLSTGSYTLRVFANNTFGVVNMTESVSFSVDKTPPEVNIISPEQDKYYREFPIWFNITTNEESIANYTIDNGQINYTLDPNATGTGFSAYLNDLMDGNYTVKYYVWNTLGNLNNTQQRSFFVDTTYPLITFTTGTENNDTAFSRNWIFANVSVIEENEVNITFRLYNSIGNLINSTTFYDERRIINWTNLLDGTYYYNVTVTDFANNLNSTETRLIILDTQEPIITIESPQSQNYNNDLLSLNYTILEQNLEFCWYSDDFGQTNNSLIDCQNKTYLSDEGSITIVLYANDSAGNLGTSNVTFFVDSIPPLITFTTGTENNDTAFSRNWIFVNVSVIEENEANITFRLYNSEGNLVNSTTFYDERRTINWTNLNDGTYYYNVTVIDVVNHINSTETRKILLDTAGPEINILRPQPIIYNINVSLPLNYTVFDEGIGTLSQCQWNLNNGENQSIGCEQNTTFDAPEGENTIYVFSNDTLGNLNYARVDFLIDLRIPSIVLHSPQPNKYLNYTNVEFSYTPSDERGLSSCILYGNWGDWEEKLYDFEIENVSINYFNKNLETYGDGLFIWNVWCNNSLGSYAFSISNYTFFIDTTPPLITFTSETENNDTAFSRNWIFANVSVIEENEANITFRLYNSEGNLVNSTTFYDERRTINWTNLNDGTYYYNVTVIDVVNHINSTETRKILLDTAGPGINILSPLNKIYIEFPIWINLTLNETGSLVLYSLDDWQTNYTLDTTDYLSYSSQIDFLEDGFYTLRIFANDTLGNVNTTVFLNFGVDTISPIVDVVSPEDDYYFNESLVYFEISTNEESIANYSLNGGLTNFTMEPNLSNTGFTHSQILEDGSYTIIFYVSDLPGNKNYTQQRNFFVDTITPLISFQFPSPDNNIISQNTTYVINVSATDLNLDSVFLNWNGSNENFLDNHENYYWTEKTGLLEGTYTFQAYANDSARNLNFTGVRILNIDLTPPNWSEQNQTRGGIYLDRFYRGEEINLSVLWEDNFLLDHSWLSTNESGVWNNKTNYNSPQNISGIKNRSAFIWQNNSLILGSSVSWKIFAGDFAGNENATDEMAFTVWGYSEISEILLIPPGVPKEENSTVYCKVLDNFTKSGIENYNVSFFLEGDYIGSNLTTLGGISKFLISVNETGSHLVSCNITNDENKYYIASNQNQASKVLGVGYLSKIYDYKNITYHRAYEGTSPNTTTPISDSYQTLENLDETFQKFRAGSGQGYAYTRFEIKVDESLNKISLLNLTWTGYGERGAGTNGYVLFVYNVTSSSWIQFASYSTNSNTRTEILVYDEGFDHLIDNNGFFKVLTRSFDTAPTGGSPTTQWVEIATDYVSLEIHTDIVPPNVSLNFPADRFKTNLYNIEFNCSVKDDYSISNLTLYGNWSGEWGPIDTNFSGLNDINYIFSETVEEEGIFRWNCYACDKAGNCAFSGFNNIFSLDFTPPKINLIYPIQNQNFSEFEVSYFNYSVLDDNELLNCSLYGDFNINWEENQTESNPQNESLNSFLGINVFSDGYYSWNVYCFDDHGNLGFNSTNFTFATFKIPYSAPKLVMINQSTNEGLGEISLEWGAVSNAVYYMIYIKDSFQEDFELLDQTVNLNYTDNTFAGERRRFYQIRAWNPTGENFSNELFGAHKYTLRHNQNTRNWIGFPTNTSYLSHANQTLSEITNTTSITIWNSNTQRRVTCNEFSCPPEEFCTETNCNFPIEIGRGYEVHISQDAENEINWSLVGLIYQPTEIELIYNGSGHSSLGRNWVSIPIQTILLDAGDLFGSIQNLEVVSRWNNFLQISQGLIRSPFPGIPFLGTNFELYPEEGYEVHINGSTNWVQE